MTPIPSLEQLRELSAGHPIAATVFRRMIPVVEVAIAMCTESANQAPNAWALNYKAMENALREGGFIQ